MQDHEPQPGDRVQVIVGHVEGAQMHDQLVANAPVLTVVRQLPYEPDHFELSDGTIHRASELHLVERPQPAAAPQKASGKK